MQLLQPDYQSIHIHWFEHCTAVLLFCAEVVQPSPQIPNDGCLQYFDFFRLCGVCLIWSRGKVVDCLQICLFQICLFQNLSFSNLTSTTFHFPAFASDCLIGLNVFPSSSHFCSHMKFGLHSSNSGLLKTHETVRYQSCIKHAADVFCLTQTLLSLLWLILR